MSSEFVVSDDVTTSSPAPQPSTSSEENASASCSSAGIATTQCSTISDDVEHLRTIFPNTQREILRKTVLSHQNVASAAEALCDWQ